MRSWELVMTLHVKFVCNNPNCDREKVLTFGYDPHIKEEKQILNMLDVANAQCQQVGWYVRTRTGEILNGIVEDVRCPKHRRGKKNENVSVEAGNQEAQEEAQEEKE